MFNPELCGDRSAIKTLILVEKFYFVRVLRRKYVCATVNLFVPMFDTVRVRAITVAVAVRGRRPSV